MKSIRNACLLTGIVAIGFTLLAATQLLAQGAADRADRAATQTDRAIERGKGSFTAQERQKKIEAAKKKKQNVN
jgi:gentisate 1,2-dioxygenase